MRYLRGFLRFWYDLVVGDDWRIAVMVVIALAVTYMMLGVFTWPAAVAAPLGFATLACGFSFCLTLERRR
jgi:hypothetical protein